MSKRIRTLMRVTTSRVRATRVLMLLFGASALWSGRAGAATIHVPAGGDLQAAIDAAQPGDVILVEAGATFVGKFTLPPKVQSDPAKPLYITIRSDADDANLPGKGQRMTPAYEAWLPKIRSSDTLMAVTVAQGASYYRLQFLELQANVGGQSDIIRIGTATETVASNQPHHIVLDRLYIHGDPVSGQRNGIGAHGVHIDLINCYVSDIKLVSTETHAFIAYNGPGPYLLDNNYLEASSINVMFGGALPRTPELTPSNIRVRHNHIAKNPEWMQPLPDGRRWNVKNLFELKLGRNVLIEGNLLEHNWFGASDQQGYAVLMRSESGEAGNVVFQNNIVRRSSAGMSLVGLDDPAGRVRMHDVIIRNNLFSEIDRAAWVVGSTQTNARFMLVNGVDRLWFDHNTMIMPNQTGVVALTGTYKSTDFTWTNNMTAHKNFGIKGDAVTIGKASLDAYTVNYLVCNDVLAGGNPLLYPPCNYFPTELEWQDGFVDYAGGNYRLKPTSPYKALGKNFNDRTNVVSDGKDLGPDIDAIEAAFTAPENLPPFADPQRVTTTELTPAAITLTGDDANTDPLTFAVVSGPASGTLTGTGAKVTYTPNSGFIGSDSFTFTVSDGAITSEPATVSISVNANTPPTAHPQSLEVAEDGTLAITLSATDPDGHALTYAIAQAPANGTLTGTPPTVTYTPQANFHGTDSFTFTATDVVGAASTATVSITVTSVNDNPVADSQDVTTVAGIAVDITLTGSDVDVGDTLGFTVTSGPANGTLSGSAPNVTYAPNPGFVGLDAFTFVVSDGVATSAPATVTIDVRPPLTITTTSLPDGVVGTPYSFTLRASGGLGQPTWSVVSGVLPPGLTLDPASGRIRGTPSRQKKYVFVVKAVDQLGSSDTQILSLRIRNTGNRG